MIEKTKWLSWKTGYIAEGCRLCVEGRKSVLFITGLCGKSCYFCPISDYKYKKDVTFINEWETKDFTDIAKEIRLCSSKGVGITGGDPLIVYERCGETIRRLKSEFGQRFHIHLYTPLDLVNEKRLEALNSTGLDEIRFHPDIDDDKLWERINLARKLPWKIGVEIPVIPGKEEEIKKLINTIKVDFLNLNELEMSDTNAQKLLEKGFRTKDSYSYGVAGSEELGLKLLKHADRLGMNAHYCTTRLKDGVQLAKRIKRRARNVKMPFDRMTPEGMLVRGAIYDVNSPKDARKLGFLGEYVFDEKKKRVLTYQESVRKNKALIKKLGFRPAIAEDYPTCDAMNIETEFL